MGKRPLKAEEFDAELNEIFKKAAWIIDGNYLRTLEPRLQACDTVFFMDYPLEVCLSGAASRIGKRREDLPWVETTFDEEFKQRILDFPKDQLPQIYDNLKKYEKSKDIIIFKSRKEADDYLRWRIAEMDNDKVYEMRFSKVYPLLVNKALKKGRTQSEVDEVIRWLTGYDQAALEAIRKSDKNYAAFFQNAPALNPNRKLIMGVVCGVRVEQIEEPLMREIRSLDKLIDELAKGKAMEKILRG